MRALYLNLVIILSALMCSQLVAAHAKDSVNIGESMQLPYKFVELPEHPIYRDHFSQISSYGFSFLRFHNRGYSSNYEGERFEGLELRDFWRDIPMWSIYSGLSNYSAENFEYLGLDYGPLSVGIGSLGGSGETYIKHQYDRRFRVTYSFSNRTYTNRATVLYHSGILKGGWSVASELTYRGGRSMSIDGVWADGWVAMGSVSKRFSSSNSLQLSLIMAPSQRANSMAVTDEAVALVGDNLYNSNWGYQDGRKRSARISSTIMPTAVVGHRWSIDKRSSLYTTALVSFGESNYRGVNWQTAPNPYPDYYRYMPSFEKSLSAAKELANLWSTDASVSQIDFGGMYDYNRLSKQAHYIQQGMVRETFMAAGQSSYSLTLGSTLFSATVEGYYTHENRYKRLEDLMGADYWLDVDYFVGQDEDFRNMIQNNMAQPNRRVGVGDKFGYYYSMDYFRGALSLSAEHRLENWKFRVGGSLGVQTLLRNGHWQKQMYDGGESLGRSSGLIFGEYSVKGGIEYYLGRRLSVSIRGMVESRAPTAQNSFIDANYRNAIVDELCNEFSGSLEVDFSYVTSALRGSASLYYSSFGDRTQVVNFYDDRYGRYTNMILQGIDSRYMGIELGLEVALYGDLWMKMGGAFSDNRYTEEPRATSVYQASGIILGVENLRYKDLRCSPTAGAIGSISFEYRPYGWNVSVTLNGFGELYETVSPIRYSPEVIGLASDPIGIVSQGRLPSGVTLDLFGGRTFYLANGNRVGVYVGLNNLLNSRGIKSGGYQVGRLYSERGRYRAHSSKYYYGLGINGFLNISFTF